MAEEQSAARSCQSVGGTLQTRTGRSQVPAQVRTHHIAKSGSLAEISTRDIEPF